MGCLVIPQDNYFDFESVGRLVGWSVGPLVIISLQGEKFHFHAPIRALVQGRISSDYW